MATVWTCFFILHQNNAMKLNFKIFVFFSFISVLCIGQNLKQGFTYLENGKYTRAAAFFKEILETHPTNKTARLCYGRAIGLGGTTKKAVEIFTLLLEEYPEDFEIKLNYAESLLWNKDFKNATTYYQILVHENSNSFSALLGYSNALSNIKMYAQALLYVNKALLIVPGNANALKSKKYIHLAYANEHAQNNNVGAAVELLHKNLIAFPNDLETLEVLANAYIISNDLSEANATFQRIGANAKNPLVSLNGLALLAHLKNKNKKALSLSSQAIRLLNAETAPMLVQKTKERYAQVLIWNRKYRDAKKYIEELSKTASKNSTLTLLATLNMYKSNFKESLANYNQILRIDSTSFDGNLGKANALRGSRQYKKAYRAGQKAFSFYKNQKDIVSFLNQLDNEFSPYLEGITSYSSDSGNNNARSFSNDFEVPVSTKLSWHAHYRYRATENTFFKTKASSNSLMGGFSYQLIPPADLYVSLGAISASSTNNYTQLLANISLKMKPYKQQNLDIGYVRELADFNADLINRELVQSNYFATYSFITNSNFGWYSQYVYTSQNDNNTRNLFFASAYYKLAHYPILKAGLNYQYMRFKNQIPAVYFSPNKFSAVEVFVDVLKERNNNKMRELFYGLTAATGFQYIENNNKQYIYRLQGILGYKFSPKIYANAFVTHSNIASATIGGFEFTEIGIKLKWQLSKQPVFKKN